MGIQPSAVLKLVLPFMFLGMASAGRVLLPQLSDNQLVLAAYLPYVFAAASSVLAVQFNRCRDLILALSTAGGFWIIKNGLQVSLMEPHAQGIYLAMALAWPILLGFLLLVPERGIVNRWGFLYGLSAIVLVLAAERLVDLSAMLLATRPDWRGIWPTEYLVLPWFNTALFGTVIGLGLLVLLRRDAWTEAAITATATAGFAVLGFFQLPYISLTLLSAAGLVQVVCLLRSSHAMAYRDDLTGLLGRRALTERLKGLGPRYSLAMLDVDHFKKFNDTHGHDVGDEVLKLVASRLDKVAAGGTAFRYGGEEFCVVFPRKSVNQCVDALEALREAVADYRMTLRDKDKRPKRSREGQRKRGRMATKIETGTVAVTISLGLAERTEDAPSPEEVIKAADKQLYRAKQAGRNRLCY